MDQELVFVKREVIIDSEESGNIENILNEMLFFFKRIKEEV